MTPLALVLKPLLSALAASGLNLLASAVEAKGKEVVEKLIGMQLPADGKISPELAVQLKLKEMTHEEELLKLAVEERRIEADSEKHLSTQITERWKFDMSSDSFLSKNIRPLSLAWVLFNVTLVVTLDGFGVELSMGTFTLIETLASIIIGAYFLGRTAEKGVSIVTRAK